MPPQNRWSRFCGDNQDKLGVELADYLALDPQWQDTVNQAVADLALANDGSKEQVNEKHELFLKTFSEKMETAVIAGVKDPKKVLKTLEQSQYLGLDTETWYSRLGRAQALGCGGFGGN